MKNIFEGECFRLELDWTEGRADPLPLITVSIEDDDNWFEKMQFSGGWLDELISLLEQAKGAKGR